MKLQFILNRAKRVSCRRVAVQRSCPIALSPQRRRWSRGCCERSDSFKRVEGGGPLFFENNRAQATGAIVSNFRGMW